VHAEGVYKQSAAKTRNKTLTPRQREVGTAVWLKGKSMKEVHVLNVTQGP